MSLRKCKCKTFAQRKKLLSGKSYVATKKAPAIGTTKGESIIGPTKGESIIGPTEEGGFCSAGMILYFVDPHGKISFLMLAEERKGEEKLNFPAGGRESIMNVRTGEILPETSEQTARNECIEELGKLVGPNSALIEEIKGKKLTKAHWDAKSKCVLYSVRVNYDLRRLQMLDNPDISEATRFVILGKGDLAKSKGHKIHPFTLAMITSIKKLCGGNFTAFLT